MVLDHLKTANLRLSQAKCKLSVPDVGFLSHRVNAAGMHMTRNKVHTIGPLNTELTDLYL